MTAAVCWHCRRRTPEAGFKTCSVCRRETRKRMRTVRRERAARGMCTRCGRCKPRKGRKVCTECARVALVKLIDVQTDRELKGLCPRCGKRPPAKGRQWCRVCLKKHREQSRSRKGKRVSTKSADRVAKWRAKQRAAGRCTTCGEPTETNAATGKPYARCELHRDEARARRVTRDTEKQ